MHGLTSFCPIWKGLLVLHGGAQNHQILQIGVRQILSGFAEFVRFCLKMSDQKMLILALTKKVGFCRAFPDFVWFGRVCHVWQDPSRKCQSLDDLDGYCQTLPGSARFSQIWPALSNFAHTRPKPSEFATLKPIMSDFAEPWSIMSHVAEP